MFAKKSLLFVHFFWRFSAFGFWVLCALGGKVCYGKASGRLGFRAAFFRAMGFGFLGFGFQSFGILPSVENRGQVLVSGFGRNLRPVAKMFSVPTCQNWASV